jgi:hypothetical protein
MWSRLEDESRAPDIEHFLAKSDRYRRTLSPYPNGSISTADPISEEEMNDQVGEGCLSSDLEWVYRFLKSTLAARDMTREQVLQRWAKMIWLHGATILQALTAVHFALHQEIMFEDA